MISRREFIKLAGTLGGLFLVPVGRVGRWFPANAADVGLLSEGELYAGFLLLPEGASLPAFVEPGQTIALHRPGENPGRVELFNTLEEWRNQVTFPLYVPSELPPGFQFSGAGITRHQRSGAIWNAMLSFGNPQSKNDEQISHISLVATLEYPRPVPVWPVHDPHLPGEVIVNPRKVAWPTTTPGVMLPSAQGNIVQWIDNDIHYMLVAEHDRHYEATEAVAKVLVRRN